MKKALLSVLLSLTIFTGSAKLLSVTTILNGANEVPSNGSPATGTLIGTFDDVTKILSFNLTFSGMTGSLTGSHLHLAAVGANGPVIIPLSATISPYSFTSLPLTATHEAALFANNIYINLHTAAFPGGEIRGQLMATALQVFTINNILDFNAIGGYSYTEGTFLNGIISSPYTRSGPLPNNDFAFEATSQQLYGFQGKLTTFNVGQSITLTFKGNNVRKIRSLVRSEDVNGVVQAGNVTVTATTNLGNTAIVIANFSSQFAGFRVMNENEYITTVVFSGPSDGQYTTIDDIMIGDDSPQNVALNFDGVNDYVSIPSTVGNFDTNDNFTVSCWFRPDPTATHNQEIIDKWDNSNSSFFAFTIRYNGSNGLVSAGQYSEPNFPGLASNTDLRDGRWHHVAFTKNGSLLSLYVDGVPQGDVTDNASGTTINTLPLNIGRRGDGNNYFKGEIDEVRIWGIGKTATDIANERFCKTPNGLGLFNSYSLSNGVPHENNTLITQVQDAVGTNHGTLNGFAKTGDASNFVTGQVKYVKNDVDMGMNNGSSWTNAFTDLQSALPANTCNDLFDVYVSANTYKPAVSDINASFNIPSGMSIYGGFAGTEKSINQRNRALIHSTNETTLSGDLLGNDNLSDFTQNRTDNSRIVVNISGKSNIIIDGFSIRGGFGGGYGGGILSNSSENIRINHCKIFDNSSNYGGGIGASDANNLLITNTYLLGNRAIGDGHAIFFDSNNGTNNMKLNNCVVAGHTGNAIAAEATSTPSPTFGIINHSYTNCTFANNGTAISNRVLPGATNNFTLKNSIIYGNTTGISLFNFGTSYTQTITYSLVQGVSTGTGNLNGNTTNPQFVNQTYTNPNNAGDYRLKDSSPCINVGTDVGVSPLDLERNPRPKGGKTDMGAYESNINMNEIISIATGNWESNSTWNLDRIPLQTDKVIMNGHTVTVTTPNAKAKNVEQKPSSDLKFNSGGSLQLNQ